MGIYLNSRKPSALYESEKAQPYFVDKTLLIRELIPFVESGNNYICITRPRRFGKTVAANMIAAYFGKSCDTGCLFHNLAVSGPEHAFKQHLNQHNVIYITLNEIPRKCSTYTQYIERIENYLKKDLKQAYPDCETGEETAVWDVLSEVHEKEAAKFLFVLDEWDYIFHQSFITDEDKITVRSKF